MAYATGSLNVAVPRLGAGVTAGSLSPAIWVYESADAPVTVLAAGYINDGGDKGMVVGDVVFVVDTGTSCTSHSVTVVAANGDVTLSAHVVV